MYYRYQLKQSNLQIEQLKSQRPDERYDACSYAVDVLCWEYTNCEKPLETIKSEVCDE